MEHIKELVSIKILQKLLNKVNILTCDYLHQKIVREENKMNNYKLNKLRNNW
jgi:hypothetical protein